jgi:Transposase DDE domain
VSVCASGTSQPDRSAPPWPPARPCCRSPRRSPGDTIPEHPIDRIGRGRRHRPAAVLEPHPASIQDRDGGGPPGFAPHLPVHPGVFADSGYAGEKVTTATLIAVEIVRKNPDQVGFAVNPRRWVVERFFAWIGRNRRLAKDFEATIDSARAFLYAASVMLLVRRIARAS